MIRTFCALALVLLLVNSCGGNDDDDNEIQQEAETSDKNLFSLWKRSDGDTLDLRGSVFNRSRSTNIVFDLGSSCRCFFKILGSQTSGTFSYSSCSWNFDGPGDPGCSQQNGTSTYRKSGNFLRLSCDLFHRPATCGQYN